MRKIKPNNYRKLRKEWEIGKDCYILNRSLTQHFSENQLKGVDPIQKCDIIYCNYHGIRYHRVKTKLYLKGNTTNG